jgi:hypothetical protein
MAASHGELIDLMESAEVCFGFKVTLRLGCFASRVEDSSRIFASSASFASFQASCMWPGSGPPSHRILSVHCHSLLIECLSVTSFRYACCCPSLPVAAHCCPLLPEAAILHAAHPIACSFVFRHRRSSSAFLPLRLVTLVSASYCLSLSFEYSTSILMRLYKRGGTASSMARMDSYREVTVSDTRAFQSASQDGFGEAVRFRGISVGSTGSFSCNSWKNLRVCAHLDFQIL